MQTYTAFAGVERIAQGNRAQIAAVLRDRKSGNILVFEDENGSQIDFDLGDRTLGEDAAPARGRPNLGVISREVTLLPRHWEWLGAQPGGASATLRRLVETARKADTGAKVGQGAAYRFLASIAGNFAHFEAAIRALYREDRAGFEANMGDWPADIRAYAVALAYGMEISNASR
jgi:uncharacterized protein